MEYLLGIPPSTCSLYFIVAFRRAIREASETKKLIKQLIVHFYSKYVSLPPIFFEMYFVSIGNCFDAILETLAVFLYSSKTVFINFFHFKN